MCLYYVRNNAALPRMPANADFSTPLKCLASGKKSIEQLHPSAPRQTSALQLLVFYCFHILFVYSCPLYYGMLILSCAYGACPTPLTLVHTEQCKTCRDCITLNSSVRVYWNEQNFAHGLPEVRS